MIKALESQLGVGSHRVAIGISIGISIYPEHANAIDPLLAAADAALYQAKRTGKNHFRWASGRFDVEAMSVPPEIWSVAHSVGIKEIDDQHAHLAGLIDKFSTALTDSADMGRIRADLNELVTYTRFHFATEERMMEDFQLESLVRHRDIHRRLLDDLQKLGVDGNPASISLVLRYLREWLLRHVDSFDKDLGRELIAKGCH